jgi:hypothetical protein
MQHIKKSALHERLRWQDEYPTDAVWSFKLDKLDLFGLGLVHFPELEIVERSVCKAPYSILKLFIDNANGAKRVNIFPGVFGVSFTIASQSFLDRELID